MGWDGTVCCREEPGAGRVRGGGGETERGRSAAPAGSVPRAAPQRTEPGQLRVHRAAPQPAPAAPGPAPAGRVRALIGPAAPHVPEGAGPLSGWGDGGGAAAGTGRGDRRWRRVQVRAAESAAPRGHGHREGRGARARLGRVSRRHLRPGGGRAGAAGVGLRVSGRRADLTPEPGQEDPRVRVLGGLRASESLCDYREAESQVPRL